uniref:Uncharacterized protein n=1 Tax=Siphoviridae sp. ctZHD14 TaxID=2827891 RepID=A0A8S5SXS1_9CAUD|nr:MAG TPA: hypothetical protein [Siphoviridae sp. ctZHD14]
MVIRINREIIRSAFSQKRSTTRFYNRNFYK